MSNNSTESRAATRAGLARLRPLAIKPLPTAKKTQNTELPDGWYFNETREKSFWEDIEKGSENDKKNDAQIEMLKKTEHVTDLQDTSSKIRNLVNQFDDIDQDTLMILMQIYDDGSGNEALDQQMIMNDSKTHVLDFMTQLKGLSDSQTQLMENLRFWFSTLQQHSQNSETEINSDEVPNVDNIYASLAQMIKEYTEKSEHAQCLHNDINDFWYKQIANYKRIVLMRDEEIRKLNKNINEATAAAQARRARKKNEDKNNEQSAMQKEQLEKQLRLNQEMKQQIEVLRTALKEGEVHNAALSSMKEMNFTDRLSQEILDLSSDMNSMKIEYESKAASQEALINQLQLQIEQLKKNNKAQQDKYSDLEVKLRDVEKLRDELDESLQKHLKLLAVERQAHEERPRVVDETPVDRQELYEAEMKHQHEIRSLNERHREELVMQAEVARQKYLKERDKLLNSLESKDISGLLQSISSECERRIETQKEEFEKREQGIIQGWAGKLALLTRQYENRIKSLNTAHEVDLLMAKDAIKFEVKKAELEFEEKYNVQLLEMGREREEKYEEFQKHLDKVNGELDSLREENSKLKDQLADALENASSQVSEPLTPSVSSTGVSSRLNTAGRFERNPSVAEIVSTEMRPVERDQLIEKYAMKMKIMKQELDDQMNWALEKQKNYFEREMHKQIIDHQQEMRERLMELQEVIAQLHEEGIKDQSDDQGQKTVNSIMNEISTAFENMNAQVEKIDEINEEQPTMTVKEANERTKVLTDRLIALSTENTELKSSQVFQITTEDEVKALKDRIIFLESLQSGDSEKALEQLRNIEEKYKHELEIKDQMLLNFQKLNEVFSKAAKNTIYEQVIFDKSPTGEVKKEAPKEVSIHPKLEIATSGFIDFVSEDIDLNIHNNLTEDHPLLKKVPVPSTSAPNEEIVLRAPPRQFSTHASRKKNRSTSEEPVLVHLSISEEMFAVEMYEAPIDLSSKPLEFKSLAFLIDDNIQTMIENDIIPKHSENEKNTVKMIVSEVFERLPRSKTQEKTLSSIPENVESNSQLSSQIGSDSVTPNSFSSRPFTATSDKLELGNPLSSTSSQIVSQTVSPRHKPLTLEKPHLSMVVIQSFSIQPQERRVRVVEQNYVRKRTLKHASLNKVAIIFDYFNPKAFLMAEDSGSFEKPPHNIILTTFLGSMFESIDWGAEIKLPKEAISIKNDNLSISSFNDIDFQPESKHIVTPQPFVNELRQLTSTSQIIESQEPVKKVQQPPVNPPLETYKQKITTANLLIIDLPYSPSSHPDINAEAKAHIEELEKEISILKRRPPPSNEATVVVVKETTLDPLKKIELGPSYMPLTSEEAKKLNEKRRRSLTKPPEIVPPVKIGEDSSTVEDIKEESQRVTLSTDETEKAEKEIESESSKTPKQISQSSSLLSNQGLSLNRGANESCLSLTHNLSNASLELDPFTAAKQIITSTIRYTKRFTDEETELLQKLAENTQAYDAYISMSGQTDESHYSFIAALKQAKRDLDDHQAQAFQLNVANEQLLKRINQMITSYNKINRKLMELEDETAQQNLAMQKEILDSIDSGRADPNIPDSMNFIDTLQKLESSINLVESLGLINDHDPTNRKDELLNKIKHYQDLLVNSSDGNDAFSKEEIDALVTETQDFIGGIKASSRPVSPSDNVCELTNEQLRADISRIRKQRDSLRRDLKTEKFRNESLQQQLVTLNNKLQSERESFENDVTSYQAQIDTLRASLASKGQTTVDELRTQIINMQALIDSAKAERDLFKAKASDAEEALNVKEEMIDQLNKQIEILLQNDNSFAGSSKTEDEMFKEADIERLKEERRQDQFIYNQQRQQLEAAIAQNKILAKRCQELEQKLIHTRQELRAAEDTIDDLNLKNALIVKNETNPIIKLDKATQVYFKVKEVTELEEKQKKEEKLPVKKKVEVKKREETKPKEEPKPVQKVEETKPKIENINTPQVKDTFSAAPIQREKSEEKIALSKNDSKNLLQSTFKYNLSGELIPEDEDMDTITELVNNSMIEQKSYNIEDIALQVHDPLAIKRKKTIKLPVVSSRQKHSSRPGIYRHFPTVPSFDNKNQAEVEGLSINNAPQGKRTLTGTIGPVKPTVNQATARSYSVNSQREETDRFESSNVVVKSSLNLPQFPSTTSIHYPQQSKSALDTQLNTVSTMDREKELKETMKGPYILDRTLQSNPITPLRITLVVHDEKEKSNGNGNTSNSNNATNEHEKDKPLFVPIQTSYEAQRRCLTPLNNYQRGAVIQGRPIARPPEMTEAQKLINKLREQLKRVQISNDQKDIEIMNLKQKISELTLVIHRVKLDNIRSADELKRSKIRYDNIKSRLDICFKEVGIRDDEIQKLKREIVVLNKRVQPMNQQIAKMQNAKRQRERLQREAEKRKAVAAIAQNALGGVTSESTKKHLTGLLEHEQVTIARLEAQRRMWAEIERNHMMGVLGAMSLLSTSQYKTVRGVLPTYSPFSSSKVTTLKQILKKQNRTNSIENFLKKPYSYSTNQSNFRTGNNFDYSKFRHEEIPPRISYSDKLSVIDKIEPPLTKEEKESVVKMNENPEVEKKIVTLIQAERDKNTISKAKIDTAAIDIIPSQ
ncbi:hypothetical protein TRFO_22196 [Tritrichomonas foetus]|uniref:Uncharacterized protein n=1 Tax=Tritrichomonas foetus TaxID=1144522 RepID=A0A1J4KC94_9EUKA|nr:hypothetical protein TRFO_22196 [Tritrichomonas foetus]|eukprot:OHT09039.1 hypothetical protein TRFO_22196 [Tritrichomonas foetus]